MKLIIVDSDEVAKPGMIAITNNEMQQVCSLLAQFGCGPLLWARLMDFTTPQGKNPYRSNFGPKPDNCPEKFNHCRHCNVYPCTLGENYPPDSSSTNPILRRIKNEN